MSRAVQLVDQAKRDYADAKALLDEAHARGFLLDVLDPAELVGEPAEEKGR